MTYSYVMVPHSVETPLPRERTKEYGTERMIYILELRYRGRRCGEE